MVWLISAISVVIVVIAAAMANRDDPFKTAAADLGLELTRTVPELSPRLDGLVDGIAAKIDIAGNREPGVRYRAFYPALGMALRLEQETTISRTLGQLGNRDQNVGATEFDQTFRINTSRPDALKTMLTPDLRQRLIALVDRYPTVVVADGEITLQTTNPKPPAGEIITTTRDLVAVARKLDAARPAPLPKPAPSPTRVQPSASPPAPRRQATPAPEKQPPPQSDPVPVTEETTATPEHLAPVAEPAVTGLPHGFFEDAFGANRLSFEKDDKFEAIAGTTVTLSGMVKQASPARDDKGGTKAVVTVAQIENDLYGKTDIDAIVYLSETIDLERGREIVFTGTADKIDAFMRNLYVINASLVE